MSDNEIKLETKLVGDIEGEFFIESYQRGYRWGNKEVTRLLEDIYENCKDRFETIDGETRLAIKSYCLQPIVVKNLGDKYELIDGQQRLTTIYLIYKFIENSMGSSKKILKFEIDYKTRPNSKEFLTNLEESKKDEYIDYWFIYNAYETIMTWFNENSDPEDLMYKFRGYFKDYVKIIWYEVGILADAPSLFTRLNIGKIRLTSSELVKAIFLSRDNKNITREKQEQIALQWDNIEKELHHDDFWYFLTNKNVDKYQTRIDLILDLIANRQEDEKEEHFTFFHFEKLRKDPKVNILKIWEGISHSFLITKDWFEDHEFYHKIGYLIAANCMTLQEIFNASKDKTKNEFREYLDSCIKESIKIIDKNYIDLSYENANERAIINRLLLLFNVESVCNNDKQTQRFPFNKFKNNKNGVCWSLEHINAQNSQGLNKKEHWQTWLNLHKKFLTDENLINDINTNIENITEADFQVLQARVISQLSNDSNDKYMHNISNLALIKTDDNAALNNSLFSAKRDIIIELDKKGEYIPFCTKMVFFKYYTKPENNQLNFWGIDDRNDYINAINEKLANYLDGQKIDTLNKEDL